MNASRDAAVDVRGVTKVFGGRAVLEDLTLRVAAGEIVALLGPNGAGKTTTLRILAGLITPSNGGGVVAGVSLDGPLQRLRARVGLLTETPGLWDRLTVRDNLLTYARLYGIDANLVERPGVTAELFDGISLDEAMRRAEARYGARVVRTDVQDEDGRKVYVLKLLSDKGHVTIVRVDAATGRMR